MKISCTHSLSGLEEHYQSDGVYLRILNIQAGKVVIGAKHLKTHLTVLLEGELLVSIDGDARVMKAPYVFEALAGSRKVAYAHTDVKIMNVIPTDKTNISDIEAESVDKTIPNNLEFLLAPLKLLGGKE
jgi:hypothetical protein